MFGFADRRARAAAKWLARMGNESAAFDRERFERWRNAHPGNARAFNDAAKSWRIDLPVSATRYAVETSDSPSVADAPSVADTGAWRPRGSPRFASMAIAAMLVAALAGIGFRQAGKFGSSDRRTPTQFAGNIATKADESRAFRLSDGSIATLGAGSELAIAYATNVRSLTLLRGQARFDVAHDPDRVFEVHAGQSLITARGTVFDVSIGLDGVKVFLLRGAIDVERIEGTRRTGDVRKLGPGEALAVPVAGPIGAVTPALPPDTAKDTMLTFDSTPLRDAVAAVNARNARKIIIDARAETETITGGFEADDPGRFAASIASMFDLTLTRRTNGDVLLTVKHESGRQTK